MKRKINRLVVSMAIMCISILGICSLSNLRAEDTPEAKPFKYLRKGRRDIFRPLFTKKSVEEERKREREEALAQKERERMQAMQEQQDAGNIFQQLFSQVDAEPEQIISFPPIKIAGIMWDPYAPILTLADSNHLYRQGEVIGHEDGDLLIVEIHPDSIVLQKTQNGVTKQKQVGIIRFEDEEDDK